MAGSSEPPQSVRVERGEIDLVRAVLRTSGGEVTLTELEARLIAYLVARSGVSVSREELHQAVWEHGAEVLSRAADQAIRRLRTKIERDPTEPRHLLTAHGVGYRWVPWETETSAPEAEPAREEAVFVGNRRIDLARAVVDSEAGRERLSAVEIGLLRRLVEATTAMTAKARCIRHRLDRARGGAARRAARAQRPSRAGRRRPGRVPHARLAFALDEWRQPGTRAGSIKATTWACSIERNLLSVDSLLPEALVCRHRSCSATRGGSEVCISSPADLKNARQSEPPSQRAQHPVTGSGPRVAALLGAILVAWPARAELPCQVLAVNADGGVLREELSADWPIRIQSEDCDECRERLGKPDGDCGARRWSPSVVDESGRVWVSSHPVDRQDSPGVWSLVPPTHWKPGTYHLIQGRDGEELEVGTVDVGEATDPPRRLQRFERMIEAGHTPLVGAAEDLVAQTLVAGRADWFSAAMANPTVGRRWNENGLANYRLAEIAVDKHVPTALPQLVPTELPNDPQTRNAEREARCELLTKAIFDGHEATILALKGLLDMAPDCPSMPVVRAAASGDVVVLRRLLEAGASPNQRVGFGGYRDNAWTALMVARWNERADAMELLRRSGGVESCWITATTQEVVTVERVQDLGKQIALPSGSPATILEFDGTRFLFAPTWSLAAAMLHPYGPTDGSALSPRLPREAEYVTDPVSRRGVSPLTGPTRLVGCTADWVELVDGRGRRAWTRTADEYEFPEERILGLPSRYEE